MDVVVKRARQDGTGTPVTLDKASAPDITETLNEPDACPIRFHKARYDEADAPVLVNPADPDTLYEYRVFVDDVLEFRGPAVNDSVSSGDGSATLSCQDALWYLLQRFLDGLNTEYLDDADFEDAGLSAWTVDSGLTVTKDTTKKRTGLKSLKIVNTGAGQDKGVRQTFTHTSGAVGEFITFSVWVHIASITAPAYESRGLHVAGYISGVLQADDYHPIDLASLDEVTADGWLHRVAHLGMPPSVTWQIQVSYMGFQGTAYWDTGINKPPASVSTAGLTGSVTAETDVANFVQLMIEQVQNATYGWNDLGIGTDCPDTGSMIAKHIPWDQHVQLDEALREFSEGPNGFDYEVNRNTYRFTIYPGGQGEDKTDTVTLYYGPDTSRKNIANYTSSRVLPKTRSTIQGDGDGVTRDEGIYTDASQLGGLVLAEVRPAPPRSRPVSLEPLARAAVNARPRPLYQIIAELKASVLGDVRKGDHVMVEIDEGYRQILAPFRCVSRTLHPYSNSAHVTLNEEVLVGS